MEQNNLTREEFIANITALVNRYCQAEEAFGDDAYIRIDPNTLETVLVATEDVPEDGSAQWDEWDFVSVPELMSISIAAPGKWSPDSESVSLLADDYFSN